MQARAPKLGSSISLACNLSVCFTRRVLATAGFSFTSTANNLQHNPPFLLGPKALDRVCALGLASVLQFVACSVFRGEFRMPRDAETFPGCKAHRQWMLPVDELFHLLGCFPEWARDSPPRSVGNQVNEFYKKRCQGKSSASTGGDSLWISSPLCIVISEQVWRVDPFS